MKIYVLTHEYLDRSGFTVGGITENLVVAIAWSAVSPECHYYVGDTEDAPSLAGLERGK